MVAHMHIMRLSGDGLPVEPTYFQLSSQVNQVNHSRSTNTNCTKGPLGLAQHWWIPQCIAIICSGTTSGKTHVAKPKGISCTPKSMMYTIIFHIQNISNMPFRSVLTLYDYHVVGKRTILRSNWLLIQNIGNTNGIPISEQLLPFSTAIGYS